jgi:hypothetical protein
MTMKGTGAASLREIDSFDGGDSAAADANLRGVGWLAYPDELMQRASHAFARDGEVWVVDPVDAQGVDDLLADLGDVAGVLVLLDRHTRDAAAIADRHDVAVHIPGWMTGVANELDGPVERLDPGATVAGFEVHEVVDNLLWQEAALHRPSDGTLYVPEALGTADYFTAGDDRLGVHPMLRFTPPRSLTELDVERLFVGHGAGITDGAGKTVASAIDRARRGAPRVWYEALRDVITR